MWFRCLVQKENKLLFKICEKTTETLDTDSVSDLWYSRRIKMDRPLKPALKSGSIGVGGTGRSYYYFVMATSPEMFMRTLFLGKSFYSVR